MTTERGRNSVAWTTTPYRSPCCSRPTPFGSRKVDVTRSTKRFHQRRDCQHLFAIAGVRLQRGDLCGEFLASAKSLASHPRSTGRPRKSDAPRTAATGPAQSDDNGPLEGGPASAGGSQSRDRHVSNGRAAITQSTRTVPSEQPRRRPRPTPRWATPAPPCSSFRDAVSVGGTPAASRNAGGAVGRRGWSEGAAVDEGNALTGPVGDVGADACPLARNRSGPLAARAGLILRRWLPPAPRLGATAER